MYWPLQLTIDHAFRSGMNANHGLSYWFYANISITRKVALTE
jgi:hypothetical protein